MKLNFDASWAPDRDARLGMVVRNYEALVLASSAVVFGRASSTVVAEALALRWAVSLAVDLGFQRVCFETDRLQLFQLWKKLPDESNYLSTILNDCFLFSRSFDLFSIIFVRRLGNVVVEFLARNAPSFARLVWIKEVPPEVVSLATLIAIELQ